MLQRRTLAIVSPDAGELAQQLGYGVDGFPRAGAQPPRRREVHVGAAGARSAPPRRVGYPTHAVSRSRRLVVKSLIKENFWVFRFNNQKDIRNEIKSLGPLRCSSVRCPAKSSVTRLGSPPCRLAQIGHITSVGVSACSAATWSCSVASVCPIFPQNGHVKACG